METIFVLTVNGEEYRLTLPAKWIMEAEKRLGESMLAALEHIDRLSVVTIVLWASMQKFGHGMTLDKAGELIDGMRKDGCEFGGETYEDFSLEVRTKLYTQLLVIAGFFTKETAAEMLANLTAN